MSLPNISIGELESPEKGAFKIGPFGSSLKKDELVHKGIPVLGIEDVLSGRFKRPFRKYITDEKYAQLKKYTVRPGDVLVTTMGTIGRATVAPNITEPMIIDSHLFRMRLDQNLVVPTYLCYALNGFDGLLRQLEAKSRGAIMAGLNTTILKECTIPLPPLAEQQRIADILSRADRLRRLRRFVLEMSDGYLQAVFLEMFGESFQKRGGLAQFPKVVWYQEGPGVRKWQFKSEGIKLLNVGNIVDGQLDLSNTSRFLSEDEAFGKYAHFLCEPNDIVMASSGVTWGKTAIVDKSHLPLCMNTSTIRLRPKSEKTLLRQYLRGFIESPFFVRQIEILITGSAQPNFGPSHLQQVEIVVPSIEQQLVYGKIGEKYERLRAQQREALRQAEHLFQGLLQAAFRGELTPP